VTLVDATGRRLALDVAGDGLPVMLIHGNFASRRWWREQLEAVPGGLRYVAPDLPNFGDSEPLGGPISLDAYARAVLDLADALDLVRPALVGHSLGAAIVHRLAALAPERWRALVLVSPPSPASFPTPEAHYPVLESFHGRPDLLGPALAAMMPARVPPYFDDLVADGLRMQPDAFGGNARALEEGLSEGAVARFTGPVLALRGDRDALITEAVARAAADAYPLGRLETWSGVGHSPQIEAPRRFSARLADFLLDDAGGGS
jgi:pimeloyl-ACP methyl ester carboxylesterase